MALCRSSKKHHLKRVRYFEGLRHKTDSDRQQLVEHYEHLDAIEAEKREEAA